ncbi:isochorismate synthase [Leifsonia sp. H3M29-4]|nr:isochorismate synthase [Salinibacterium metalliresistens]MDF1477964.1 isochorismate synthase [Salinibacterium metalliresistens]
MRVVSSVVPDVGALVPLLEPHHPLAFVRDGDGIIGFGDAVRLEFRGPDRIVQAARAWRELAAAADVADGVNLPGSGLVAFGSFTFAPDSEASSVLIVPRVIVGRRDGTCFVTRVDGADDELRVAASGPEYRARMLHGQMTRSVFTAAVRTALERIADGTVSKVVLARDLIGHIAPDADLRRAITHLSRSYRQTFTYAVEGLIGSSPETLVRSEGGIVDARVLAGSSARGEDADADAAAAEALVHSAKDLGEHDFALQSVLDALRPHTSALSASAAAFALKLPNLWHLASDVTGALADGSSALDLVAALHPTAAVAGAPTDAATALIRELEPFDRGRYAGPVGWVDAAGDGEWAIALRCAQVTEDGTVHAYAGAGIVAGSDPDTELEETALKFRPIVDAFG